jgi:hypothetical protein
MSLNMKEYNDMKNKVQDLCVGACKNIHKDELNVFF